MTKRNRWINIGGCVLAAVISMVICAVSWRLWEIDLSVLPGTGTDNLLCAFMYKSVQEYGLRGIIANYMVGAPGYSALVDIPMMDFVQWFQVYVINLFTGDFIRTMYVFYLVSFGTAAAAMYFLLARFSIKWWVNTAVSVIFAVAPYHFYREIIHASLSNYMAVPIIVLLGYVILEDQFKLLTRNEKGKLQLVWRDVFVLAAAGFVGIGQVYYAYFAAVVMAVALLMRMLRDKSWRPLLMQGLILYVMCGAVVVGMLPKLLFSMMYGENVLAGLRMPFEAELYGLKLIQLLLPSSFTRLPVISDWYEQYVSSGIAYNENSWASLGLIGSAAFLGVCGWLIYSFIVKKNDGKLSRQLDFAALSTLTLVLFATVGGVGAIFNYLVTPQIRCYNRVSILIACLVLTAGALVLDRIRNRWISAGVCVLLLAVGFADQVPVREKGWQNEAVEAQEVYESFFGQIEDRLEDQAMVYELPYTDFPEVPPTYKMNDYMQFLGYLFTDTVRWSYGGIKGRNPEAKMLYIDNGMSERFIEGLQKAGFAGVYIDTYGYADEGAAIVEFYRGLGCEMIVSDGGRFYFFEI